MKWLLWYNSYTDFISSEDKTGICPVLDPPPPPCVSDVDECYMDNDCLKDKKCCYNGCYKICVSPSIESGAAAGILLGAGIIPSDRPLYLIANLLLSGQNIRWGLNQRRIIWLSTLTGALILYHQGLKSKSEGRKKERWAGKRKKNHPCTHPPFSCSPYGSIPSGFSFVRALDNVSKNRKCSPSPSLNTYFRTFQVPFSRIISPVSPLLPNQLPSTLSREADGKMDNKLHAEPLLVCLLFFFFLLIIFSYTCFLLCGSQMSSSGEIPLCHVYRAFVWRYGQLSRWQNLLLWWLPKEMYWFQERCTDRFVPLL